MKNILAKSALVAVALSCASAFAVEKITITGQPIALQSRPGNIFAVPTNTKLGETYQFVTLSGKQKACFTEKKTDYKDLEETVITVQVNNDRATWNCYSIDNPTFFEIQK